MEVTEEEVQSGKVSISVSSFHGVGSGVYVEGTEEEVQSGKVSISVSSSTESAPGSMWRLQRRRFSPAR